MGEFVGSDVLDLVGDMIGVLLGVLMEIWELDLVGLKYCGLEGWMGGFIVGIIGMGVV